MPHFKPSNPGAPFPQLTLAPQLGLALEGVDLTWTEHSNRIGIVPRMPSDTRSKRIFLHSPPGPALFALTLL